MRRVRPAVPVIVVRVVVRWSVRRLECPRNGSKPEAAYRRVQTHSPMRHDAPRLRVKWRRRAVRLHAGTRLYEGRATIEVDPR